MKKVDNLDLIHINAGLISDTLGVALFFWAAFPIGYLMTRCFRKPHHFQICSEQDAELAAQYVAQNRHYSHRIYDIKHAGR